MSTKLGMSNKFCVNAVGLGHSSWCGYGLVRSRPSYARLINSLAIQWFLLKHIDIMQHGQPTTLIRHFRLSLMFYDLRGKANYPASEWSNSVLVVQLRIF